jgi:CheY-like chemotaxis protein
MRDCVLVVDDEPDFRELVALYLADWGLKCVEASNCSEALPLVERERAQLRIVLLDYFMPGPPPLACLRSIRARLDPDADVALVSAAVDIRERAAALGVQRYLAKPFEASALQALVLGRDRSEAPRVG